MRTDVRQLQTIKFNDDYTMKNGEGSAPRQGRYQYDTLATIEKELVDLNSSFELVKSTKEKQTTSYLLMATKGNEVDDRANKEIDTNNGANDHVEVDIVTEEGIKVHYSSASDHAKVDSH